jgi:CubicO group peptidase (beta-lactamase class C family)
MAFYMTKKDMQKLLFIVLIFLSSSSFGQNDPPFIDTLFYGKNGLKNKIPGIGISIGIFQDGKSNFYSFGNVSHTSKRKVDKNTVFEIGSNTKLFTALLLAIAVKEGKIPESAFIDPYLPKEAILKPGLKNKIRLISLASFSSGLPTLHNDKFDSLLMAKDSSQPYKFIDKKYLYNILNNTSEVPNYGMYEYSNFNYGLIGAILENFTKTSYSDLLQNDIFKQLGLRNTWTNVVKGGNQAGGYYENKEVEYLQSNALSPAGVIKSDAVDMLTFIKYQLHPPNNTIGRAIVLTQQIFTIGIDVKTGLGWHILNNDKNEAYYVMQGDTIGNSSLFYFDKKSDVGIVILINQNNHDLTGILLDYLMNQLSVGK